MNRETRRAIAAKTKQARRSIIKRPVGQWTSFDKHKTAEMLGDALAANSAFKGALHVAGRSLTAETTAHFNNRYEVLITEHDDHTHLRVSRITREPINSHWSEMNRIKNELIEDGSRRWGMEFYPPEADLVDQANWYHMLILKLGAEPQHRLQLGKAAS